jgi:hypothetical protein
MNRGTDRPSPLPPPPQKKKKATLCSVSALTRSLIRSLAHSLTHSLTHVKQKAMSEHVDHSSLGEGGDTDIECKDLFM